MNRIILGYPFSGALHAYISDQLMGKDSHTKAIGRHPYYTTLYGRDYKKHIEQTLMFSLLYDEIYFTPADNVWPESALTDSREHHPELGLRADWESYGRLFNDDSGIVSNYLEDTEIKKLLGEVFRIPKDSWKMVMSSILFEYFLSRELRCPIMCSYGRRKVLERLVEIDRPSLHPSAMQQAKIEVVGNYLDITGLLLAPGNIDNFIKLKGDKHIREYSNSFLNMLGEFQARPGEQVRERLVTLMSDAMETESISQQVVGLMSWAGKLMRIVGLHQLSFLPSAGSLAANHISDGARWYSLADEVKRFESKSQLMKNLRSEQEHFKRRRDELP